MTYKLANILKEIGDSSSKLYKITSRTRSDKFDGEELLSKFKTDSGLNYTIEMFIEEDVMDVSFYVGTGSEDKDFGVTNDFREMFRVLGTVFKEIQKQVRKRAYLNKVTFTAADAKESTAAKPATTSKHSKSGSEQRTKLYKKYIEKIFPAAEIETDGIYTTIYL